MTLIGWFDLMTFQNIQLESQVEEAESHSSSHAETYQEQVMTLKSQLDDLRKVLLRPVCVLLQAEGC